MYNAALKAGDQTWIPNWNLWLLHHNPCVADLTPSAMQRIYPACRPVWKPHTAARVTHRRLNTPVVPLPEDFAFFPAFFTVNEQCVLLRAALRKLDAMDNGKFRRRRREFLRNPASHSRASDSPVQALFLPDELYDFQEAC